MSRALAFIFCLILGTYATFGWAKVPCDRYLWSISERAVARGQRTSLQQMYAQFTPINPRQSLTAGQEVEGMIEKSVGAAGISQKVAKKLRELGAKNVEERSFNDIDSYQTLARYVTYKLDGEPQKFSIRLDEDLPYLPSGYVSIELTSPILSTERQANFYFKSVKAAKKAGFTPIATGGVHSHIGLPVNNIMIAAILKAWTKIESGVLEAFAIHEDREEFIAPLDREVVDLVAGSAMKDPKGIARMFELGADEGFEMFAKYNWSFYLKRRYLTSNLKPNFKNEGAPLYLTLNSQLNETFKRIDQEMWKRLRSKVDSSKFENYINQLQRTAHFRFDKFGEALGIQDSEGLNDVDNLATRERHVSLNLSALRRFGTGELRIFNSTTNDDLLVFQNEFSHGFFMAVLSQDRGFQLYLDALESGRQFDIRELATVLKIEGGAGRVSGLMEIVASEAKAQAKDLAKFKRQQEKEQDDDDND